MLTEGRGRELAGIHAIVMLSCPNEGSEYLASIRAMTGMNRHPQAGQLKVLESEADEARRIVLRQVVNATGVDARQCLIPFYVYSGRTNNVVLRQSALSAFPFAEVLPGDHSTILDPGSPGNLTLETLKRHLLQAVAVTRPFARAAEPSAAAEPTLATVTADAVNDERTINHFYGPTAIQIGDGNSLLNYPDPASPGHKVPDLITASRHEEHGAVQRERRPLPAFVAQSRWAHGLAPDLRQ